MGAHTGNWTAYSRKVESVFSDTAAVVDFFSTGQNQMIQIFYYVLQNSKSMSSAKSYI